ncbi:hypothetical protein KV557_10025 [Kitasatospora aureofaciens]|nr:hypothetical protein [Kitasatospora aureofaciens]MBV6697461.1 hypothetical protein [Kitasatospora aureofaciens]
MSALLWTVPAVLAYAGLYLAGDHTIRLTLRLTGACAIGALTFALILRS